MKLVIFDIDGTLTNSIAIDDECMIKAVKEELVVDIKSEWFAEAKTKTSGTDSSITNFLLEKYFTQISKSTSFRRIKNKFLNIIEANSISNPEKFNEIPGAKAFFELINARKDCVIGIATGSWEKSAKIKLNSLSINPEYFAFSNSDFYDNRHEILRHTIGLAKMIYNVDTFERITYFGDGEWDLRAAQLLNIGFIGVDNKLTGHLSQLGVKYIIENFSDPDMLMYILDNLDLKK